MTSGQIMSGDEDNKSGFKVMDRRRFDSEGEERTASSGQAASSAKPGPSIAPSGKVGAQNVVNNEQKSGRAEMPPSDTGDITFSSFIMSLATQALMQLGEMKPPPGVDIPLDPIAAKQTIDIIALLDEKTKGNLNASEAEFLEDILHNLRIGFVKKTNKS